MQDMYRVLEASGLVGDPVEEPDGLSGVGVGDGVAHLGHGAAPHHGVRVGLLQHVPRRNVDLDWEREVA